MKKIILIILFCSSLIFSQGFKLGEAKGLFFSVGVGPKTPIGDFSATNDIGIGFDFTASYTDNQFLPVFLYAKLAYQTYPGSIKMYKTTNYASFTTNEYLILPGLKFYLPPVITDEIIIMPIVEVGPSFGLISNSHVFKESSGEKNYDELLSKFGLHLGAGFSMFFLETTLNYYFFPKNHSLSLDLIIQIPVFAKI
ncbi:MAG: hypothetical protein KKF62_02190 [Bacteroidetes bacterium]|nr:hypothetical protein [Bacteroidota bacterium]MBU1114877.1 hypothetical protein [Bacteroidota bacterium]MBU1798813.1 hypothetical protein [Bacteroidota bacterium]